MRLVRYGPPGNERPGMLDGDGRIRDCSDLFDDWRDAAIDPASLEMLSRIDLLSQPLVSGDVRLGCPVSGIGKIIGVGLNYADHAAEAGIAVPAEPVWFLKATSAITGAFDPIIVPDGAVKLDWEVELAIVIGSRASYVDDAGARASIAGYTIINDVSERSFQLERGGQWTKGKSCDSFAPLGPWLVTHDEVGDPDSLDLWLDVNGARQQGSNTKHLIFDTAALVSELSRYMSLEPGDVIATGTPAGVGFGQTPQRFLREGDIVELGIAGLGHQRQIVEARQQRSR